LAEVFGPATLILRYGDMDDLISFVRALEGQLTLFVGGDEAVLRRVKPVLATFSRSVVWVGELGAGSITKIVHNALAMSIDLLLTECLTLGAKAGVTVPRLVEAFREQGIRR
jgi:3-hydroxyisobutyrate dehydrogenase